MANFRQMVNFEGNIDGLTLMDCVNSISPLPITLELLTLRRTNRVNHLLIVTLKKETNAFL